MTKKVFMKGFSLYMRIPKKYIIIPGIVILILILLLVGSFETSTLGIASFTISRGPFLISIPSTGEVFARNSTTITTPDGVSGNLQIIYLIEEGTQAQPGDLLIQFDTNDIDARIEDREDALVEAEEELEKLKANQSSQMASLQSSLETTRNNYELSKLRLEQMQFEAETKRQMEELNFKNAEINLKKQEQNIENQRIINDVNMRAARMRIERARKDLERTKEERERLFIRAPTAGLVVYKENWRSETREKIKTGDTPYRRQALIELPDLSVMEVQTSVNELDIRKVQRGQKARIRMDAIQDEIFTGSVTDIAYLARREGGSSIKVFDVLITMDTENHPLLRPGMSASVEIITEEIPDAAYVPLESVFEKDGKILVYVVGRSYEEREVTLGKRNNDYVIVENGIQEGEKVALRDPTIDLEEFGAEIKERKAATPSGNAGAGRDLNIDNMREMMRQMRGRGGGGMGGGPPGR